MFKTPKVVFRATNAISSCCVAYAIPNGEAGTGMLVVSTWVRFFCGGATLWQGGGDMAVMVGIYDSAEVVKSRVLKLVSLILWTR